MQQHYRLEWVRLIPGMKQAHPGGQPREYPGTPAPALLTHDFAPGYEPWRAAGALRMGNYPDTAHATNEFQDRPIGGQRRQAPHRGHEAPRHIDHENVFMRPAIDEHADFVRRLEREAERGNRRLEPEEPEPRNVRRRRG
jgi:hypothetical protein